MRLIVVLWILIIFNIVFAKVQHKHELKVLNETDSSEEDHGQGSFDDEGDSHEQEDKGDSEVSEERNPEDFINSDLTPVKLQGDHDRPEETISIISSSFNNRKSFTCPKIKAEFVTGKSTADLSPEDIGIIAAMGDSLATGRGLWPRTDIDFRGAAFPIGGDATIDGLITIPNILREFTSEDNLHGVSHGMGGVFELPSHQLNVAEGGATTASMPKQAKELVKRIRMLKDVDLYNTWAMVIITIGTEEVCSNCSAPDTEALTKALGILKAGIYKAFVILLGPIHVSSSYHQKANLLKTRCACSKDESNEFMEDLSNEWIESFATVAEHATAIQNKNFGVLTLPMLTVTSRYPYSLFIPNKPLLNRRGHNYATKWLWNRLIAGSKYNLSNTVLSQEAYFCPSVGCPYFRTLANYHKCTIMKKSEAAEMEKKALESRLMGKLTKHEHYKHAMGIVGIAFVSVIVFGTFFYYRSKLGTRGRFDAPPVPDGLVSKPYSLSVKKLNDLSDEAEEGTESALLRSRPPSARPFDVSQQNIFKEAL
ncbi:unnamed protein product [Bursaphelenchus okinawaensis]|uniref:Lipase_GDSL domain-containing protein n=1 Tax=Bursaphelenchus okinawaensis TaxID=465554 RepID=A0A811JRT5_9BILA|nr:unnamed protein product [Bursaphelenchus okinawaensis]CAG9080280.1 unnamed protein product [Bursaphelenchus okinawaensis]